MPLVYLLCYLVWFQIVQPDLISAQTDQALSNSSNTVPKLSRMQQMKFLQNKITEALVEESYNISRKALDERIEDDLFFYEQGVDTVNGNTSIPLHNLYISHNASLLAAVKTAGILSTAATKHVSARLNLSRELVDVLPKTKSIPRPQFNCPFVVSHHCNSTDKYRTADGSCNNLQNPIWGRAGTPQIRFLSPIYEDGISSPRTIAVSGKPLPSARLVSTSVHQPDSNNTLHRNMSHMVMQWGQFIDHDITSTPIETGHDNSDISCCIKNASEEIRQRSTKRLACFPIQIPENDRHFKSKCLNFVRSLPTPNVNCTFGYREQFNKISSFIDGGTVYGNSIKELSQLRSHVKGQMKKSFPNLLPKDFEDTCIPTPTTHCFKAGDNRVNEQMGLVSIHTLFFRDHNRIAHHLNNMTPASDEKIFQETKRIVTAIIQHINYNEFLPTILNTSIMKSFDLISPSSGFNDVYNSMVDPSIRNAFSAAAFRFGHSMVRSFFTKLSPDFHTSFGPPTLLKKMFFNTSEIFADKTKSVGAFVRGLLKDKAQNCDRFLSTQLTDHLFEDKSGHSFDLAAFNIQRGRDHGLPPYNSWRKFCGLSKVTNFGIGSGGLVDHNILSANQIQSVYDHPDDIDLFTGGMSENPIQEGVVGPTFACIIARQFQMFKTGDRFWYERDNPTVGFSIKQLDQIRKMTLSKLVCLNTDISQIQRNAFLVPGPKNPLVSCDSLPNMDLNVWS